MTEKSKRYSLLAGRNQAPLSQDEMRRASNTFLGMDSKINSRYEESSRTAFKICFDESGQECGEIIFGPDIYPGRSVVDPNSALGLEAAVAHELTHYYRWKDKTELPCGHLDHLDEALTSLQAILRYYRDLNDQSLQQLVSDAVQRIQLYAQDLEENEKAGGRKKQVKAKGK